MSIIDTRRINVNNGIECIRSQIVNLMNETGRRTILYTESSIRNEGWQKDFWNYNKTEEVVDSFEIFGRIISKWTVERISVIITKHIEGDPHDPIRVFYSVKVRSTNG